MEDKELNDRIEELRRQQNEFFDQFMIDMLNGISDRLPPRAGKPFRILTQQREETMYPKFKKTGVQTLFDHIADVRNDSCDQEESEAATALLEALYQVVQFAVDSALVRRHLESWQREDEQERYENMGPEEQKRYNAEAHYDSQED